MNKLLFAIAIIIFSACANRENTEAGKDPSDVHPPSEAIPDTLKLQKDSVIVPDSSGDTGVRAKTETDSTHK